MDVTTKTMKTMLLAGLATLVVGPSVAQVPLTLDTSFRSTQITLSKPFRRIAAGGW